jgi:hypothetical protein
MEQGLTKNQVVQELMRSTHAGGAGKSEHLTRRERETQQMVRLSAFIPIVDQAAHFEPEFLAHLTAWNQKNGQVRDSMIALPVGSMKVWKPSTHKELLENSFAHLAIQSPRDLLRGLKFGISQKVPGRRAQFKKLVDQYLRHRESRRGFWDAAVVTHRDSMSALYSMFHIKPAPFAARILFENEKPRGSVFWDIAHLKEMGATEAATTILKRNLPMQVLTGAGIDMKKLMSEDVLLSMVKNMSPTEIVTNMKLLKKAGITQTPALRGVLTNALEEVAKSTKNVLKTGHKAREIAAVDENLARRMQVVQEKQLENFRIEGDWAVFGDASPSMQRAIELAKMIAGFLSSVVKGKVYLCFMDTTPRSIEVTDMSYEQIKEKCKYVRAGGGGTSLGCGLDRLLINNILVDGIVMVSDGAENSPPMFAETLKRYQAKFGVDLPVCHYWMKCDRPDMGNNNPNNLANSMDRAGLAMQTIDLREIGDSIDYYALPNLVATMQTKRYSLIDAIMDTPLLTRAQVFS